LKLQNQRVGKYGTQTQAQFSLHGRRVIMTEAQILFSSRLAALQHTLTSGNEEALDLFWQEIEMAGTPLIESITGGDVLPEESSFGEAGR
jgi:hypothetical protein